MQKDRIEKVENIFIFLTLHWRRSGTISFYLTETRPATSNTRELNAIFGKFALVKKGASN